MKRILNKFGLYSEKDIQETLNENEDLKARINILTKENEKLNNELTRVKDSLKEILNKFAIK